MHHGPLARVGHALRTLPDRSAWRRALQEAAWAIPLAVALVWLGGLADFGWTGDPEQLARLALVAVIAPALGEELLFRAALLPSPASRPPLWRQAMAVALFVAWHPPQALLFGAHWGEVVLNPWFLAAVAVVGAALTRIYLATGSIWPCVAVHWVTIVGWKALFGAPSPWISS